MFYAIAEAAALASSLSIDAFTAGVAYGSTKTRITFTSIQVINLICGAITGIALFLGVFLKAYIPGKTAIAISFAILFIMGLTKLLDGVTKSIIRKYSGINKRITGSLFNFKFVLSLYANPEEADVDASKTISPKEAAMLALSLSLDGIAVGFGAALADVNGIAVVLWSLLTNAAFLMVGYYIGRKIVEKTSFNVSWLSGAVLIGLAISKLF